MKKKYFIFTFVLALIIRLIVAISSMQSLSSDAIGYDNRAIGILTGKGFSGIDGKLTSFKEPFYSFFLAAIYYIFGHNYTVIRIIQAILGTLSCVFIFLIAKKLFDVKVALICFLISAINPALVKTTGHLLTENLFVFLYLIAIYFLIKQSQEKDFKNLILLGITLGITTLTRSVILYFPIVIILLRKREDFIFDGRKFKRYILSIVIFILCFVFPIAPWTIRNWYVHHRFVPIDTKTGIVLYSSYFPKEGKIYGFTTEDATSKKAKTLGSEVEESNFLIKETLKFIVNNPLRVLKLEVLKIIYFWSPFDWEIIGGGTYNFIYGFIFPFFIYGIILTFKRFKELLPIYLPIIYSFFIALIAYGSPRFRLAIEPFLIILGAAAISHLYSRSIPRRLFIISSFILISFNFLFYIYSGHLKIFAKSIINFLGS